MKKKVLIVDDAIISRMFLKQIFEEGDYEVVGEANNGLEGIRCYQELHPDLVTMDITMPMMNGIEALRQIRRFDPEAKVLMCTALGQKFRIAEAMEAGAAAFVVKPFQKDAVLEAVRKIIN